MIYDNFPLNRIFETNTYPHARTLRTSFWQKIRDSYYAIAGRPAILSTNPHVGIFDYLTLYISTGLFYLLEWAADKTQKYPLAAILLVTIFLINLPFLIARVAVGVVITLAFSPIITVVHGVSAFIASKDYTDALNLVGHFEKGGTTTLKRYLEDEQLDIEDLEIRIEDPSKTMDIEEHPHYELFFSRKKSAPSTAYTIGDYNAKDNRFSVKFDYGKDAPKQPKIHALFKLNIGNVVTNIEKSVDKEKEAFLAI